MAWLGEGWGDESSERKKERASNGDGLRGSS